MVRSLRSQPHSANRHSEHFDTVVRVRVGEGDAQEVFEIYKGLLKFYSGYFRAAIDNLESGRFFQAEENTIALPNENAAVFKIFKSWLFTRSFGADSAGVLDFRNLLSLWCFGDRRQMPLLQNQAIDFIHKVMAERNAQPTKHHRFVYANTREGSPLRKFLISSHVRRCTTPVSTFQSAAKWTHEILVDIGKELALRPAVISEEGFADLDMCDFHIHEEGVSCKV